MVLKAMPKPCDFKCCPCLEKTFRYKDVGAEKPTEAKKEAKKGFRQLNNKTDSTAAATQSPVMYPSSSCDTCGSYVNEWVTPGFRGYCGTNSCNSDSYFPYQYTYVPKSVYYNYQGPDAYYPVSTYPGASDTWGYPGRYYYYGNPDYDPALGGGWGAYSTYPPHQGVMSG